MSVSLKEVLEGAGYDFEDLEDLDRVKGLLYEADDLLEEVNDHIDYLENRNEKEEREEAEAEIAMDLQWREENGLI